LLQLVASVVAGCFGITSPMWRILLWSDLRDRRHRSSATASPRKPDRNLDRFDSHAHEAGRPIPLPAVLRSPAQSWRYLGAPRGPLRWLNRRKLRPSHAAG
jgi:hypothetical protein